MMVRLWQKMRPEDKQRSEAEEFSGNLGIFGERQDVKCKCNQFKRSKPSNGKKIPR